MQQQLDFTKLYCQLHPYQLVTNYCNDEKCLTGLCATCICSHTEMHAQLGTIPRYQNIRDTFCSLHDEARSQIAQLQENKNRLGSLRQSIEVKKINLKKTIRQLKEETLNKIRDDFQLLQKKIMSDVNNQEKKQGYHSNIRFQSLSKNLCRQTDTLLGYIEGLNSPFFLQWTKKLKRQALIESNQNRLKIQKEISDNENYTANLKWNQNFIEELSNSIKKMFTLQFIIPKQNGQMKNCMPIFRASTLNVMNRSNSQPKISQNMTRSNSSLAAMSKFAESNSFSTFFSDPAQKSNVSMQKQSFLRKNNSMISQLSQSEILGAKQNWISQSSYIPNSSLAYSMQNNSSFTKAGFQNQRISNLIDLKKSNNFQSMRTSALSRDGNILLDACTNKY